MKSAASFQLVLVTAPDLKVARRLANAILTARLAACVNLLPRLESHYRWKGRVEKAAEVLLLIKTSQRRLAALEQLVLNRHPYETPEFLVLNLRQGSADYLKWLAESVA